MKADRGDVVMRSLGLHFPSVTNQDDLSSPVHPFSKISTSIAQTCQARGILNTTSGHDVQATRV